MRATLTVLALTVSLAIPLAAAPAFAKDGDSWLLYTSDAADE